MRDRRAQTDAPAAPFRRHSTPYRQHTTQSGQAGSGRAGPGQDAGRPQLQTTDEWIYTTTAGRRRRGR